MNLGVIEDTRERHMSLTFVEGYMGNYDWEVRVTDADEVIYEREELTEAVLKVINDLVTRLSVGTITVRIMNVGEDNADVVWEGPYYALGRARVVIETLYALWEVQRLR